MPVVGLGEYAKHRGVSRTAVEKAIAAGRITLICGAHGHPLRPLCLDRDTADAQWASRTTPSAVHPHAPVVAAPEPKPKPTAKPVATVRTAPSPSPRIRDPRDDDDDGDPATESLADARTRRETAQADIAEFTRDQTAGRLVEVAAVRRAWTVLLQRVKSGLLAIPSRTASTLAAIDDEVEVRNRLDAEIRAVLRELTDDPPDPRGAS